MIAQPGDIVDHDDGRPGLAALWPGQESLDLADATLTLLARLRRGERVWEAHRSHFYQRATDNGYRVIEVVARVFALNLLLAALAAASIWLVAAPGSVLLLAFGGLAVTIVLRSFATMRT